MTASRVDTASVEALTAGSPARRLDAAGVEVLATSSPRCRLGGTSTEVLSLRTVSARAGGVSVEALSRRTVAARAGAVFVEVLSHLTVPTSARLAAATVEVASTGGVYRGTASRSAGLTAEVLTPLGLAPSDYQAPAPPNPNVGPWTLPW